MMTATATQTRQERIRTIMRETGFDEDKATLLLERYERGFKSDIEEPPDTDLDELGDLGFTTPHLGFQRLPKQETR